MKATVTYSIVSEESSESGDYSELGVVGDYDNLREAIKALFSTRTNEVGGVESLETGYLDYMGRFQATVCNAMEYRTGDNESRDLFIDGVTKSSATRIERAIRNFL